MLYIVATPIGNIKELSFRAVEVLAEVDCIYAENPRHSLTLLNHYNIKKPVYKYERFSEKKETAKIIERVKDGQAVALISDAGMPTISDPGGILISAFIENRLPYTVISGACALINALVLSGFSSSCFSFLGFLPPKEKDRKNKVTSFSKISTTLIFYISVHSIDKDLEFLYNMLGDKRACLVKEITKKFEQVLFFSLANWKNINSKLIEKGEFVLIIENNITAKEVNIKNELEKLLAKGLDKKTAIKRLSEEKNIPKNKIYKESIND